MNRIFLILFFIFHNFIFSKSLLLDEKGINLKDISFKKGMLEINLNAGKAIKLKLNDLEVGFLYIGSGNWQAKVEEKYALQVFKYNVKNGSHLNFDGNILKDSFKSAMIFGIEAINVFKGEEIIEEKIFEEKLSFYEKEIFDQKLPSPPSLVLNGIVNNLDLFGAIFEGGKDELIYTYDPFWTKEENLYSIEKSVIRRKGKANINFENLLINQPITKKREDPLKPPIIMENVEYEIDLSDINNIYAIFKEGFKVQDGNIKMLPLSLLNYDIYLRKSGELIEEKYLYVESVLDSYGKELDFIHEGDVLNIKFPNYLEKNKKFNITIKFGGNIFAPTPNMSNYVNLSGIYWFPAPLTGYESINAIFSGKIKTKKPFISFASFDDYNFEETNENYFLKGSSKITENFHSISIGKYFYKSKMVLNKINVTVASCIFPNERAYKTLFDLSEGILDFYEYFLKGYPYKHLNIIEGRWVGYGHAPPGIIWVGAEVFDPYWSPNVFFSTESNETFAHEIAHQYFGHLVKCSKLEDTWLEEALAEYISAFWYGRAKGEREFKSIYSYWYNNAKEANDIAAIYGRGLISGDNSGRYYLYLTYCKGPVLIHSIRKKVGDQLFFTLLRSFLRSFEHKQATTKEFIELLEYLTKEDWKEFFDKYLFGMEMPPKEKN